MSLTPAWLGYGWFDKKNREKKILQCRPFKYVSQYPAPNIRMYNVDLSTMKSFTSFERKHKRFIEP